MSEFSCQLRVLNSSVDTNQQSFTMKSHSFQPDVSSQNTPFIDFALNVRHKHVDFADFFLGFLQNAIRCSFSQNISKVHNLRSKALLHVSNANDNCLLESSDLGRYTQSIAIFFNFQCFRVVFVYFPSDAFDTNRPVEIVRSRETLHGTACTYAINSLRQQTKLNQTLDTYKFRVDVQLCSTVENKTESKIIQKNDAHNRHHKQKPKNRRKIM